MNKVLKFKTEHIQAMQRYVAAEVPLEACGLLAGKQDSNIVEAVLMVRNAEQSPVRFRMDAQEQYNAFNWIEAHDFDLLGIFHSHPSGPETVSPTDIDEAAYDVVHVIWSRVEQNWKARGFWIENGQVYEVALRTLAE